MTSNLLDKKQVADFLGITVSALNKWVAAHKIPFIKVNGVVRFQPERIEAWLAARTVEAQKVGA